MDIMGAILSGGGPVGSFTPQQRALTPDGSIAFGKMPVGASRGNACYRAAASPSGPVDLGEPIDGVFLFGSFARSIASNGLSMAGTQINALVTSTKHWTSGGGWTTLPNLAGSTETFGNALSSDGTTIVGRSQGALAKAFRWTAGGGTVSLGATNESYANDVSSDGLAACGIHNMAILGAPSDAFHWSSGGGITNIGKLPGGGTATATNITENGLTVFGNGNKVAGAGGPFYPWKWTSGGGLVDLGFTASGGSGGELRFIADDGSAACGNDNDTGFAWVWTPGGGFVPILNTEDDSGVYGMSGDGAFVIGYADTPGGGPLYFWRYEVATTTIVNFTDAFHPVAISYDGSVVLGYDVSNQAVLWPANFNPPI